MNNFNKYFGLMALLFAAVIGFLLLVVVIFFILKLCSVTLFYIPGFDKVFQYIVTVIPYLIFFSAYYYMHKKIPASTTKVSRALARILMIAGSTVCFISLLISTVKFSGIKKVWINTFEENSHYSLILHIVLLFVIAAVLATGDAKEKHWMERGERIQD